MSMWLDDAGFIVMAAELDAVLAKLSVTVTEIVCCPAVVVE